MQHRACLILVLFVLYLEITIRQKNLLIHPDTVILCVVDPKPNIGSGGATLNAILHITEHISAIKGYTVSLQFVGLIRNDVSYELFHMGGEKTAFNTLHGNKL